MTENQLAQGLVGAVEATRSRRVWSIFGMSILVSALVYTTSGPGSPFLFLYLPLVMGASIVLSRTAALIFAGINAALYTVMAVSMMRGLLPAFDTTMPIQAPTGGLALQVIGLLSAMILIAILTSYLNIKLKFSDQLVADSKRELEELNTKQQVLLEDVSKLKGIEEQLELQERMGRLLASVHDNGLSSSSELSNFVGESPVMQKVFKLINRVAPTDATVLIDGESGTGKELVARSIHFGSTKSQGAFIPVNCGAIPENLIESELFGHKRGSYTGADTDRIGLFREAECGTVFLDEIAELPLQMQTKLLRVLQEKCVRPIGYERDIPIDVRIIAATNKNLRKEVELGNFREDLFYRLNVIHIMLPPLRERTDDIPLLVNAIAKKYCKDRQPPMVTPAAMQLLVNYSYPGNVRELENMLERAIVLGGEAILPEHFPEALSEEKSAARPATEIIIDESLQLPCNLESILSTVERKYLEIALLKTNGAKKKAAALLGINFRSFRYRLQKFGIGGEDREE